MAFVDYESVPTHEAYDRIIELTKDRFSKRMNVTEDFAFFGANFHIKHFVDTFTKQLVIDFTKEVLYYKQDDLKYPSCWIDAFKERWFPKWLLEYYPVEYTWIEVREYYPRMAIPESKNRYIRFRERREYGVF